MGKARKSNTESSDRSHSYDDEKQFKSKYTGEMLPLGKLTSEEMDIFLEEILIWLEGFHNSPDETLTEKDLEYVGTHLSSSSNNPGVHDGHLYRIEKAKHFNKHRYKIGDKLRGNGAVRSFSKDIGATNRLLKEGWTWVSDAVIYRTVGDVPFFDVTRYVNPYPLQKECFVPSDAMRIVNIKKFEKKDYDRLTEVYGFDGMWDDYVDNITVVDVEYDSSVSSVDSSSVFGGSMTIDY